MVNYWDRHSDIQMAPELHQFPSRIAFSESDSPSRRNMVFSQISQHIGIEGACNSRVLTGSEREYAKWTHGVYMPCNGIIRKIINKFQPNHRRKDAVNPLTVVIYEDLDNPGHFGLLEVPHYFSLHYQFGFKYKRSDALNNARVGQTVIEKGTPLAQSPHIDSRGNSMMSTELNVAFMTRYEGIEDGAGVCVDVLPRLATRCYQTITVQFGKNQFPLNMFGDDENYQIFPHIGQSVKSDCLIMALRRSDPILNAVNTDPASLRELDHMDTPYVAPQPNARIVDIDVIRTNVRNSSMLNGMDEQLQQYCDRTAGFYNAIENEYLAIKREVRDAKVDAEFSRYLRMQYALKENRKAKTNQILAKPKTPLDEYMVTFKLEYVLSAIDASKSTDYHGGKFVFTKILQPEEMPVDEYGVRADIVLLDEASANRMNVGRDHFQAVGAAGLRTEIRWDSEYGNRELTQAEVDKEFDVLCKLYDAVDPAFHDNVVANANPRRHIEACRKDKIYVGRRYDTGRPPLEMLEMLDASFDIDGTIVTWRNYDGEMITSNNKVLIAPLDFIMLDKVADVAAATSSSKMQHFNTPANLSSNDKITTPYRDNATRFMGEVEGQLVLGCTEKGTLAESLDQTTNAISHTEVAHALTSADNPMDVEYAVDRKQIPLTMGRPQAVLTHVIQCSGIDLKYSEDE